MRFIRNHIPVLLIDFINVVYILKKKFNTNTMICCHDGNLAFIAHRSISYEAINLRNAIHFISPYSMWRCSALAQRLICEIYIRYTRSFPFLPRRRLPQSTEVVSMYIYIIYIYIHIYYWLFDLYVIHKYLVLHFIYIKSTITENV